MDLELAGKRAIVTGASSGIGLAVARALHAEGAQVAMLARSEGRLRAAAEGIGTPFVADTADDASVRAAVAAVAEAFGGVDVLVNSAARATPPGGVPGPLEVTDDDVRAEIEVKVLGYLRTARAVAPLMAAQGWGRIVNVSGLGARSTGSLVGSVRNVAVAAMTKNLADELGPHGVNVTVVHPGLTTTDTVLEAVRGRAEQAGVTEAEMATRMASGVSIGRLVTPAEVADVVAFLCSPRSVAVTGDAIAVGGGAMGAIHY